MPEEANTNITLEDTERQLKQVGRQYAKDNAQRVHEERIANQAKVETLTARFDEAVQLVEKQQEQISI